MAKPVRIDPEACPMCGSGDWDRDGCGTCGHPWQEATGDGNTPSMAQMGKVRERADSHTTGWTQEPSSERTADAPTETLDHLMGDVPLSPPLESPASSENPPAREKLSAVFKRRMEREGRWKEVSLVRDRMMVEAKKAIPDKEARRAWVYGELDRMYPPLEKPTQVGISDPGETDLSRNLGADSGQIQGLSDVPKGWPDLPANASLAAEIGWVQANRLFMVEERPGKATRVRLDQAASPAPSRAALGWLETSIRSYAKFVDVAARVSGDSDDEGAVMKRERRSIDEVRALIQDMLPPDGCCPTCGQPVR